MLDEEYWSQRLPLTLRTWVMPPRISQLVRKEQLEQIFSGVG